MPLTIKRTNTVIAATNSVLFNGSNQYLSVARILDNSTDVTIEFWAYVTSTPAGAFVVAQYVQPPTGTNRTVFAIGSDLKISMQVGSTSVSSTGAITLNTWNHLAFVRNGSGANNFSIYINGVRDGQMTYTGTFQNTPTTIGGSNNYDVSGNSYFPGYISNLRILKGTALYTGASFSVPTAPLTAIANTSLLTCNAATIVDSSTNNFTITNNNSATVSSINPFVVSNGGVSFKKVFADAAATATLVTNGLVLNLDASNASSYTGSGTSWFDLSGNGNTGTLTNGPTFNSANSGSIVFDGTNDYVDLGNVSQLKPTTQITVSAWVYRSTMNDNQDEAIISCTQAGGYELFYSTNKMAFYVYAGGSYRIPEMSTSAISGWMNFTATYDNRYAKLYYNGVLQNTVDSGATNNISYVANNILIGAEAGGGSARESGFEWTGNIAQTLIYNASLSASEVLQNYNATKAKFGLGPFVASSGGMSLKKVFADPIVVLTQKAIFGYGNAGATVSMTNIVSNTGVVATDTAGVGTVRRELAAAGYGSDKAIFGYGDNGPALSMTNLVSNTGVVSADTTGVGTARSDLAAAGYGIDKAIFGYGNNGITYVSITNLVSNTGVVASDTTGVGTARYMLAAAGYGTDKSIFGYGYTSTGVNVSITNKVSNMGVVATDTAGVGTSRYSLAAAGYGSDKAIFGYGLIYSVGNASMTNLVSNTGVVATDTAGVGTGRYSLAAAGYGSDKAIFGYGFVYTGTNSSLTNLVSNTGVVATNTTGVGTARTGLAASGFSLA